MLPGIEHVSLLLCKETMLLLVRKYLQKCLKMLSQSLRIFPTGWTRIFTKSLCVFLGLRLPTYRLRFRSKPDFLVEAPPPPRPPPPPGRCCESPPRAQLLPVPEVQPKPAVGPRLLQGLRQSWKVGPTCFAASPQLPSPTRGFLQTGRLTEPGPQRAGAPESRRRGRLGLSSQER